MNNYLYLLFKIIWKNNFGYLYLRKFSLNKIYFKKQRTI